jgi:hypothetical protein
MTLGSPSALLPDGRAISRLSTIRPTSQPPPIECRDAKQKKRLVTVVTSREAETIACEVVTAEISLALFWGETALQSMHEVLSLAGHELQSQEIPESRI